MITIEDNKVHRVFSAKNEPVAYAKPGDIVKFHTMDAMGNQYTVEDQIIIDEDMGCNPGTGPLFIEGAHPGMILKVEVLDIELPDICSMSTAPDVGVFGDEIDRLARNLYPIRDGKVIFNDKISVPVKPMLGVIGVAPKAGEEYGNPYPGYYGANLDCKKITIGSTVYFPIFVEGALLSIGDVHAVMGDGEVCICGAECTSYTTVRVSVVEDPDIETIMVISDDDTVSTLYVDEDLTVAAFEATKAMRRFVAKKFGLDLHQSARLLSLVGDMGICEVVDPLMTARMQVPKYIFDSYGYTFK